MFEQKMRDWYPDYLNGRLPRWQARLVERWLAGSRAAREYAANLAHLQNSVRLAAPEELPSAEVWQGIAARLTPAAPRAAQSRARTVWAAGLAVCALLVLALWSALPPGIVLQWSVQGDAPQAFHVYRAERMGETDIEALDFALVEEMPAAAGSPAYRFMDVRLVPGHSYVYRVDALDENGQLLTSQVAAGNGWDALPGQLALVMALTITAYGAYAFAQPGALRGKHLNLGTV
jgi:hypothetical protein